jgi:hypothetical protein
MKVTAASIAEHDQNGVLGKVLICWISHKPAQQYGDQLDEVKRILRRHGEVEIVEVPIPADSSGWFAQQAVKLKVASRVKSDWYVVLDAKNTLLREVEPHSFITPCNQGKIFGRYSMPEMPSLHREWYEHAAEVLSQSAMDWGKWPASITPMVMHRQTVLDLLTAIGEPHDFGTCSGGLCSALGRGATEFTLYLLYVGRVSIMKCIHVIEDTPWNNEISASIWRSSDGEFKNLMAKQVEAIAEHSDNNGNPLFFGAQAGSLESFAGDERYDVLQNLWHVYANASLYSFKDWDEMAACVG